MNSRQLKRGENIVGLTQTEIMLVLTIVVLVLLLAGDIDLNASQKRIALLEKLASESRADVMEIQQQIDLAKEIKGELNIYGKIPNHQRQSKLTKHDVQTVKNIIEKSQKMARLQEALEDKQKAIDRMREQSATRKDERKIAAGKGNKYGYTPCWPRTGLGPRKRYHTYDVTYANGLYRVQPSSDLHQSKVPELGKKLDRKLSTVLRNYPRKAIPKQDFAEFGKLVENVLTEMRGDGRNGWYEPGCSLVVTLNPEAPGSAAAFIRESVGMWPITRSKR